LGAVGETFQTASTTSSSLSALEVQFRCEAHLGVDNAVAREVECALARHAMQLLLGLHECGRVAEAFEVAHEVTARRVAMNHSRSQPGLGRQSVVVDVTRKFSTSQVEVLRRGARARGLGAISMTSRVSAALT